MNGSALSVRWRTFGFLSLTLLLTVGCSRNSVPETDVMLRGRTMGTTWLVRVPQLPAGVTAKQLTSAIQTRLDRVNDQMSTWREDSELSRFNRHASTEPFPVSPELAAIVQRAAEIHETSDAAFDPTIAPLVNLWSFGPERRADFPTDEEITDAKARMGFDAVIVRTGPPTLKKSRPEMELDLSAIAKGDGVDAVADLLDDRGVTAYLVEIGGEVRTKGRKRDGTEWTVGITVPEPSSTLADVTRTLKLTDAALATSGDYRNFREGPDGKRYAHILDPRTGRPADHNTGSVTVVADDCATADAWATALGVLGEQDGLALAEKQRLAAYFIVREPNGTFRTIATKSFRDRYGE